MHITAFDTSMIFVYIITDVLSIYGSVSITRCAVNIEWPLALCMFFYLYSFAHRFGLPVVLRVRRNLTHTQFQSVLLHSMRNNLRDSSQDLQDVCYNHCMPAPYMYSMQLTRSHAISENVHIIKSNIIQLNLL